MGHYAVIREDGAIELRQDGGPVPEGAINLSPEQHAQLASGLFVLVGGEIVPYVEPPPPNTDETDKEAVLSDFRTKRDIALPRLSGIIVQEMIKVTPDQSVIEACNAAIEGLKAMSQNQTVIDAVGGEQTEDALQVLYDSIGAQLRASSVSAYTAFRGLDL